MIKYRNAVCIFGKYMQNSLPVMMGPLNYPVDNHQQVRNINKHWNPKFKKQRKEKFIKVELPNTEEKSDGDPEDISKERMRSTLKKLGIYPQKPYKERPAYVSSTSGIFESYVAPEGDGKFSTISKEGAKQKFEFVEKKGKSYLAVRKIKSFDDTFSVRQFTDEALEIYKKAHDALAAKDTDAVIQHVTEYAYGLMTNNIMDKTVHWKFLESLEPARVVHARCTSLITKTNIFAQITVRFHSQQLLCIYDRFGRLVQGSEILRKDVLEYVVFERHMANEYGSWRIHGKIIPTWMPPTEPGERTYALPTDA